MQTQSTVYGSFRLMSLVLTGAPSTAYQSTMNSDRRHQVYPDPTYVDDEANGFYGSPRIRRFLNFIAFVCFLAGCIFILAALVGAVVIGISNWVWIPLCIGVVGCLLLFCPVLWIVPLRCSHCSGFMQRRSKNCCGEFGVVFYICPACKRYVDSGLTAGCS